MNDKEKPAAVLNMRHGLARIKRVNVADGIFGPRQPGNFPLTCDGGGAFSAPLFAPHQDNGDEAKYAGDPLFPFFGNFSKGLEHDDRGAVNAAAYRAFVSALMTAMNSPAGPGTIAAIDQIPRATVARPRPFVNPLAGLAFDLNGGDAWDFTCAPAPVVAGPESAAEMVELYWMALLRDTAFTAYDSDPLAAIAAKDVGALGAFTGPRADGKVTPGTLFRGSTPGDLKGHYLSQFMLKPAIFGTQTIDQRQKTAVAGIDYMTTRDSYLAVQRGADVGGVDRFDTERRYIRNLRDLATYVHFDALYQAYFNACLILLELQGRGVIGIDKDNPYATAKKQIGFGTYGGPHILSLVTEVATRALKAVWFQKWFVHRRLRPEMFGGRIDALLRLKAAGTGVNLDNYVHKSLLESAAGSAVLSGTGGWFLPQAFPEGSPMHPAYGAGHATVAGACVTILKAWFNEEDALPDPVVPNADGTALVPDPKAPGLTVGGELNKLAANIAIGRNGAGVHWRTDYTRSMSLGEAIAVSILQEQSVCYAEGGGFTLTTFCGKPIKIWDGRVMPA
ncbi:vanadium-dependent haloperoxidase [Azospirillum sp. RWY-5-1]|uniref:Vanadium-dependent haloperoxidase n=1 Tax=Azospirillum oleiclasticum TaxID=2735135 RepID=A0ABX2TBB5_9PROT|nr:vanadium-dependent haloperoxidase [Azospirillum oleiclasticum]NYZ14148.1 vanadium-dependent haloperoxidase [Azospirillum oleiclasticum]NYZ21632.1 vanadium-dependent haloperoxidase [Azospirillum oleiclasticum]